jgi:penicillin-binding protein 2
MRISVLFTFFSVCFLILTGGLAHTSVINGTKFARLSERNSIRVLAQPGARGRILDRSGGVIVDNVLSYDVLLLPQRLNLIEDILRQVSGILGEDFRVIRATFRAGYTGQASPVVIAKNIDRVKAVALEELKSDLPGIFIQPSPVRHYPHGSLACHILGYVNEIDLWRLTKLESYGYKTKDMVGFMGVEEKYDYYLRQEEGGVSFEVDHRGRLRRTLGFKQPRNGRDVQLTVDMRIQQIVESSLAGMKGAVIVMDPETGEIVAMASAPVFSPDAFVRRDNALLRETFTDPEAPLINRAISGVYPPGSIFKVISVTAALESRKLDEHTTFLCTGSMKIGRLVKKCWDEEGHGLQNAVQAIAHSCNIYFYNVGMAIGGQVLHDWALKFGCAKPTGIEVPFESSGSIPSPLQRKVQSFRNWYDGDSANVAIGQGEVLTTPLQMTRMMAVFANGGYLVKPYILQSLAGQDLRPYSRKAARVPLKPGTLEIVRKGLRDAVAIRTGTGSVLSDLPVDVAGKTGTAQAPPGQTHAWFVGFFPFEQPKYVICVFLERGGPGYYACVVARQIIAQMVQQGLI